MPTATKTTAPDSRILTAKGRLVDPLHLKPEDMDIGEIAHALSNICRYGGQAPWHYSVAQHSCLVAEAAAREFPHDPPIILGALLHDAHEAYLGDTVRPLRRLMEVRDDRLEVNWKLETLEMVAQDAVAMRFDLAVHDLCGPRVTHWDNQALVTEVKWLWGKATVEEFPGLPAVEPLEMAVVPCTPDQAAKGFLAIFAEQYAAR